MTSPSSPASSDRADAIRSYNARLGIVLFLVYLALYAAFIGLSAFKLDVMGKDAFGGVNLAVVYGLALIGMAIVMAVLYMVLCKAEPEAAEQGEGI